MKGLCVEVADEKDHFNNKKRGIVEADLNRKVIVNIAGTRAKFNKSQLLVVFTLGLPREARTIVKSPELTEEVVHRVLATVDTTKFFMAYIGSTEHEQHFAKVRSALLERALNEAIGKNKEPLLRIYIADYSQNDPGARILFGDSCVSLAAVPAIYDMDAETLVQCCLLSEAGGSDLGAFNLDNLKKLAALQGAPPGCPPG